MNQQQKILDFLATAEKLKTTLRHCHTSNSARKESAAEHAWMAALLALILFHRTNKKIDELKTLKLIIVHDLAEAVTGDIPAFEKSARQTAKAAREKQAIKKLVALLPADIGRELAALWREFEERKTAEAKLAQVADKIEVMIQHNISSIKTWEQGDFDINPYYKNEYCNFDKFVRKLKDLVDRQTMKKIDKAGLLSRVKTAHLKKYQSKYGRNKTGEIPTLQRQML